MAKKKVFISYRRDDAAGFSYAIHDRLVEFLPDERVFMECLASRPAPISASGWKPRVNAGARLHRFPEQRCINDADEKALEHGLVSWASSWGQIVFGRVGAVAA
jgi:hypothetical protein